MNKKSAVKLAYLANNRFPSERAHAVQIVEMCNAFEENGVDVTLFVNTRSTPITQTPAEYYGKQLLFSVKKIWVPNFVPPNKYWFQLLNIIYVINLLRAMCKDTYDIFYIRNEWLAYLWSFMVPLRKIVWESHEAKYNYAARSILRRGVRCVCISEGIFEEYQKKCISSEKLMVAHDGIDESFFGPVMTKHEARAKLGLPQDKKIVMYIGGFDAWKGVDIFCSAGEKLPGVLFAAIGGSAEQLAQYKMHHPKIIFLGTRPYKELKDNQQAADVLVIPNMPGYSVSERFTSPLKLFAHMSSGIPLVISDLPSLTVVTGGRLVTQAKAGDPLDFVRAINEVLGSYNTKMTLAKEMYNEAAMYTWAKRALNIIQFFR